MDRQAFIQTGLFTFAEMLAPSSTPSAFARETIHRAEITWLLTVDSKLGTEREAFASLERARRETLLRKKHLRELLTVRVHGGTYYLEAPLVFGPE